MNMKMWMKLMIIRKKFLQFHITSVSSLCARFTLKICQIVADTSMIRQFHESLVDIVKNIKLELVDQYEYEDVDETDDD
jgi:hypothetical protein